MFRYVVALMTSIALLTFVVCSTAFAADTFSSGTVIFPSPLNATGGKSVTILINGGGTDWVGPPPSFDEVPLFPHNQLPRYIATEYPSSFPITFIYGDHAVLGVAKNVTKLGTFGGLATYCIQVPSTGLESYLGVLVSMPLSLSVTNLFYGPSNSPSTLAQSETLSLNVSDISINIGPGGTLDQFSDETSSLATLVVPHQLTSVGGDTVSVLLNGTSFNWAGDLPYSASQTGSTTNSVPSYIATEYPASFPVTFIYGNHSVVEMALNKSRFGAFGNQANYSIQVPSTGANTYSDVVVSFPPSLPVTSFYSYPTGDISQQETEIINTPEIYLTISAGGSVDELPEAPGAGAFPFLLLLVPASLYVKNALRGRRTRL